MAEVLLREARTANVKLHKKKEVVMQTPMPSAAAKAILRHLDLRTRTRFSRVCNEWRDMVNAINSADTRTVWIYVIFRRKHSTQKGHEKTAITMSSDGPIFWSKMVVYAYCCSCHFHSTHEAVLMGMMNCLAARVNRLCIVDQPIDYPFLHDSFFLYIAKKLTSLQFLYLREIDIEHLNVGTVHVMANHPTLKKVIVHQCRNFDVMQSFGHLPQLLVVNGEIQGLKMFIGDIDMSAYTNTNSRCTSVSAKSSKNTNGTSNGKSDSAGDSQATDDGGLISPMSEEAIPLADDVSTLNGNTEQLVIK